MIISQLQNLDQETAAEICATAGEEDNLFERLLNNVHNGVEVAVLRCEVEPCLGDPREYGYYDIAFADGSTAPAVSGYHLVGIENWR